MLFMFSELNFETRQLPIKPAEPVITIMANENTKVTKKLDAETF